MVVGHLESIDCLHVERLPERGEIVEAVRHERETAGLTSVAAVQAAKLGAHVTVYTRLGDDEHGRLVAADVARAEVALEHGRRAGGQRRGTALIERGGERTIVLTGPRHGPSGSDPLPWDRLVNADAAFFVSGDAAALRSARRARMLVATARSHRILAEAAVPLDVLLLSADDPGEGYEPGELRPAPRHVVRTAGANGGEWWCDGEAPRRWRAADVPPSDVADTYGAGDSFAGGLLFALAAGLPLARAIDIAARCGAAVVRRHGPYDGQLTREDVAA